MNKIINSLLLLIIAFASAQVYATCDVDAGDPYTLHRIYTANMLPVVVQRDTPVGTVIESLAFGSSDEKFLGCTGGSSAYYFMSLFTTPSAVTDVYNTNVPGVGVRLAFESSAWSFTSSGYRRTYPNNAGIYTIGLTVSFVKTGNITSGIVNSGMLGYAVGDGNMSLKAITVNLTGAKVTQVACSVATEYLSFPIGDVPATNFSSTPGTIPSGGQNTQNLGLSCDPQANINVSLSGTQNPDIPNSSVLALTGQGSAGVASGVGVQLLYNGSPFLLNNRIVLKQSSGGQETFPLTARYYQTKSAVTTGTANTSATLNITYQ